MSQFKPTARSRGRRAPKRLHYDRETIYGVLRDRAERSPDRFAVRDRYRRLRYRCPMHFTCYQLRHA